MDATRSHVANLSRVLSVEHLLNAQGPGLRVRQLLRGGQEVRRGRALIGYSGKSIQTGTAARRKASAGQEAGIGPGAGATVDACVHVTGSTELRRNREQAQVVVQNVIRHAKA